MDICLDFQDVCRVAGEMQRPLASETGTPFVCSANALALPDSRQRDWRHLCHRNDPLMKTPRRQFSIQRFDVVWDGRYCVLRRSGRDSLIDLDSQSLRPGSWPRAILHVGKHRQ